MPDKSITCRDCENIFTFSEAEQAFYADKGFSSDPVRCKPCRIARKASRGETTLPTRRTDLHEAVCSDCGGVARVPFAPRDGAQVFCSDCFRAVRK